MSVVNRDFGKPPVLKDSLPRAKEFTDMAMSLVIDDVLTQARTIRNIGKTAGHLSGVKLQLEGEIFSKDIVTAAYDQMHDVMAPSLQAYGPDRTARLFKSDTTHATLTQLSAAMDSYEFSKMTHAYAEDGLFLDVDLDGLVTRPDFVIEPHMQAQRGGCPYAKNQAASYFNRFTDRIVDTFVEADRRNMPTGWFQMVARQLNLQ